MRFKATKADVKSKLVKRSCAASAKRCVTRVTQDVDEGDGAEEERVVVHGDGYKVGARGDAVVGPRACGGGWCQVGGGACVGWTG